MPAPAVPPTVDVFLSYKREDRMRVMPILDGLRAVGLRVWWDGDIPGGARWRQALMEHIDSARCVIVVWSEASVSAAGEFVQEEAGRAKSRHVLLPLRIDDVSEPLGYGEIQSLDLINWSGAVADPRFRNLVLAVNAMIADGPKPEPAARMSESGVIIGWLYRSITFGRGYISDLFELTTEPRRFLSRPFTKQGATLEQGVRFLAVSFLLTSLLELPLARGNPLFEFLADAGFVCVYVLLYGYAAYFAWRLAGGVAPIEDFFRIHFYLSGLIKLSQTAFYIMARGLLRSDRALSDEVMSNVYRGDLLWLTTNVARLSGYPIFQLFVLVLLCGWIATLIWLLIGWGAYRELTGLTRSRSLLAFLIFCILCVPVYILTTLISAALVS